MSLSDAVALVTGGSHGIGRATAKRLAEDGATVVIGDVETNDQLLDRLRDQGHQAEFSKLDVADHRRFQQVVNDVVSRHDQLDVLVNNAGVGIVEPFGDTSIEERDRIIDVNIKGVWNGCQAAIPPMVEQGTGSIINMASTIGLSGGPNFATYAMSKAAVVNLTKSLAAELGPRGVRVNAVCAARVETRRFQGNIRRQADPEGAREALRQEQALRRFGEPEDIANAVAYLASDDASYVTGHGLVIDGGALLPSYDPDEAMWG